MTYEVCYSKDKTTNLAHVKTIIRTKTIILAIHIHSTLTTLHHLQGCSHTHLTGALHRTLIARSCLSKFLLPTGS